MSKLHELLAVEPDLRTQTESCRKDLQNTFDKKTAHFSKKLVTFKSLLEGVADKIELKAEMQTTVAKELSWIAEKFEKAINAGHHIDVANTLAKADIILDDGTVLLSSIPATSLLRMEHRVLELRELIHAIPTLDPAKGFEFESEGVWKAREESRIRTEKHFKPIVMVPPTKEHPAQVKELMVDEPVGTILTQEWSSLVTVSAKGDMLDRVEELLRAIKQAKARANEIDLDVKHNKIGKPVLEFLFGK